jgi:hypothetical protein
MPMRPHPACLICIAHVIHLNDIANLQGSRARIRPRKCENLHISFISVRHPATNMSAQ